MTSIFITICAIAAHKIFLCTLGTSTFALPITTREKMTFKTSDLKKFRYEILTVPKYERLNQIKSLCEMNISVFEI